MSGHAGSAPPPGGRAPLAAPQQQLWLVEKAHPGLSEYNEARALRVLGPLDLGVLRQAISAVVDRHEALRTTVWATDGQPEQVITAPGAVTPEVEYVCATSHDPESAAESAVRAFVERPYDLHSGPLARWLVVRLSAHEHVLVVGAHHIICDGFAMNVIFDEIADLVARTSGGSVPVLPGPSAQYREFARWQRERTDDGYLEDQLGYWLDTLRGAPTVLSIAGSRLRPPSRAGSGGQVRFSLPPRTMTSLREIASLFSGTPFTVLFATFAALVHRYTGSVDFILGTGAPGRPEPRFDRTVGFFTSVLPVRLNPVGQDSFRKFASEASEAVFDGFDHQCASFPRLVEVLDPDRDPSVSPLIQVVFAMWDAGQARRAFGPGSAIPFSIRRGRARFDLAVEVVHCDGQLELVVEYDTALLGHSFVTAMVRHYDRMLQDVIANPDVALADIAMLEGGRGYPEAGRADRRVWSGPFQVRLEDVEEVLRADPRVSDVAVIVDADAPNGMTAYVAIGDGRADPGLRDIAARLPRYARPVMVAVPEVPRDAHGDLEVARLAAGPSGAQRRPWADLLARVCDVWAALLSAERVEPDDDFFALGGHSTVAAELAQELSRELGVKVPVRAIFECPTPAELAAVLFERHPEAVVSSRLAPLSGGARQSVAETALSSAQLEIWINERLAVNAADFMGGATFRIRGSLDADSLRQALNDVADRHPAWRASVHRSGDLPVMRFAAPGGLDVEVADLIERSDPAGQAGALVREQMSRKFDLSRGPLVRVLLIRLALDDWLLVLTQHHLITDGVSMRVLCRDLAASYAARSRGDEPSLPPPATNLAACADWEAAWLNGPEAIAFAGYWRRQLSGVEQLRLAPAPAAGKRAERRTGSVVRTVDATLRSRLTALEAARRSTGFMIVTAAFAVVLAGWSTQRDLLIGTTTNNRDLPGANDLLGCFVNSVALRIDVDGDPTFETLLGRVRATVLAAYERQRLPFRDVVRGNGGWTDPTRMPLFQVTSDWVDYSLLELAIPGCDVEGAPVAMNANRYELSLYTAPSGDRWELTLEYARDLWDAEEIAMRLDQLCDVLAIAADNPMMPLSEFFQTARLATSHNQTEGTRSRERGTSR